ncbi:MAG: sulfocyanin-like copper-binding protein [Anaerolineales bacterium]
MKKLLLITVIALSLVLTACGPKTTTINITATDSGYDSKTYTVPAGQQVTISLTNKGAIDHKIAVLKKGEEVTLPFSDNDQSKIYWELENVSPGTTKSGTFTAPTEAGEYTIICDVPGHIEMGMTATLIVK